MGDEAGQSTADTKLCSDEKTLKLRNVLRCEPTEGNTDATLFRIEDALPVANDLIRDAQHTLDLIVTDRSSSTSDIKPEDKYEGLTRVLYDLYQLDGQQEAMRAYLAKRPKFVQRWDLIFVLPDHPINQVHHISPAAYVEIVMHHYTVLKKHGILPECFEYLEQLREAYYDRAVESYKRMMNNAILIEDLGKKQAFLDERLWMYKELLDEKNQLKPYKPRFILSSPAPEDTPSPDQESIVIKTSQPSPQTPLPVGHPP